MRSAPAGARLLISQRGRLGAYAGSARKEIAAALRRAGGVAGLTRDHEISVVLCDNATIRAINKRWRGKDKATDVLSFPLHPVAPGAIPPPGPIGDIVVSLPAARQGAAAEGLSPESHMARLAIHGLLHLLGHDHEKNAEAERMHKAEERLLGREIPR